MKIKRGIRRAAAAGMIGMCLLSTAACDSMGSTKNLTARIYAVEQGEEVPLEDSYITNTADFSIRLFQKTASGEENSMISPVSVLAAMSMAANGAKNKTLKQMSSVLYQAEDMTKPQEAFSNWLRKQEKTEDHVFSFANSIWIRDQGDGFTPNKEFLQKNVDRLDAQIYSSDFSQDTADAINKWVKKNTHGMITKIIDRMDQGAVMHLINGVAFEGEWEEPYEKEQVMQGVFTGQDGSTQDADYLSSVEGKYIKDEKAEGIIKSYKHGYSFVALLPNKGETLEEYIRGMNGREFLTLVKSAEETPVDTQIPKFKNEYETHLQTVLSSMGITDAFDAVKADFSEMGKNKERSLYINDVLHKTYIQLDEQGTRASAVTDITLDGAVMMPEEMKEVKLTRPFVYAIIEDATGLPIFLGTVTNL